jgi:P-type E1-E2 ATPase
MLTGDNWATARRITTELGVEKVFAKVRPDQKVDKVKEIQQEGKLVAMVGTVSMTPQHWYRLMWA